MKDMVDLTIGLEEVEYGGVLEDQGWALGGKSTLWD